MSTSRPVFCEPRHLGIEIVHLLRVAGADDLDGVGAAEQAGQSAVSRQVHSLLDGCCVQQSTG
jgi:hypothetical protein